MSERRDNSGALFKNDKQGVDSRPDYTGNLTVAGVSYWLSAWIKDGERGKFMSIAVKPKDAKPAPAAAKQAVDDYIPFR